MSAPSTASQSQPQKAPRRSGKKGRLPIGPGVLEAHAPIVPPVSEAQRGPSPPTKNNNQGQHRRPSQPHNKHHIEGKTSVAGHEKIRGTPTPIKPAAYAGSTFQQSPAASALPLPSFYSKSLPNTTVLPQRPGVIDRTDSRASSNAPIIDDSPGKRETTPCDFLFEAARQAKSTPRADSPATRNGSLNVPNGSPAPRSPAAREGDAMFPFELDGAAPGDDGNAFATPFKDRMDALRSTSAGGKTMDEMERKAKTAALKDLLMRSSGPTNGQMGGLAPDPNNPFNARPPRWSNALGPQEPQQLRSSSNPSTPYGQHGNGPHHPGPNFNPPSYPFPTPQTQTPKRPNSSRLRNVYGAQSEPDYAELSSDSAMTPPRSTLRKPSQQQPPQYGSKLYGEQPPIPGHRAKPSAQQLEDDLRRVLKLDLTSRG